MSRVARAPSDRRRRKIVRMPGFHRKRFRNHTSCCILGLSYNCAVRADGSSSLGTGWSSSGSSVETLAPRYLSRTSASQRHATPMKSDEFKTWGYKCVDWIAAYLEHPEQHAVLSQALPGSISSQLPASPP